MERWWNQSPSLLKVQGKQEKVLILIDRPVGLIDPEPDPSNPIHILPYSTGIFKEDSFEFASSPTLISPNGLSELSMHLDPDVIGLS